METTDTQGILAAIAALGDRVERQIGELKGNVGALDTRIRALETEVAELKGEMRGEMRQMSARISDVYTRLPVPIAYQPPGPGKKRAG
ncbi:MAG: hypothetical protein A3G18_06525 [Rhodospirillales bacterium RIFCSPLOWO2_12_FULL_58_28]|nr:MAG: hypothetical protein A3H92_08735 [Rhodospirillales bacterium RIFCSPLOWO2_02_FULL_58_16]OHC79175.1 MAG: hypothetical protein A3G18_06525 [Rhodospirillales bacterium RIFCSPLOWO2_12_FULL_58_28]